MKSDRNVEGYFDPTASRAIRHVSLEEREAERRAYNLIKVLKSVVRLCGFELIEGMQVKDMRTGKEYPRKGNGDYIE